MSFFHDVFLLLTQLWNLLGCHSKILDYAHLALHRSFVAVHFDFLSSFGRIRIDSFTALIHSADRFCKLFFYLGCVKSLFVSFGEVSLHCRFQLMNTRIKFKPRFYRYSFYIRVCVLCFISNEDIQTRTQLPLIKFEFLDIRECFKIVDYVVNFLSSPLLIYSDGLLLGNIYESSAASSTVWTYVVLAHRLLIDISQYAGRSETSGIILRRKICVTLKVDHTLTCIGILLSRLIIHIESVLRLPILKF